MFKRINAKLQRNMSENGIGLFISQSVGRLIGKLKPKYSDKLRECIADLCEGREINKENIEGDLMEVIVDELIEAAERSREKMERTRQVRSEAGKKGAEVTNGKSRQMSANVGKEQQITENVGKNGYKDKYKYKDKDKYKYEIKQDEIKQEYAKSVFLSESEFSDLVNIYGGNQVDWMVRKLSSYKLANGKTYESDYNAILSWVVEAYQRENMGSRQQREAIEKQQRDLDFAQYAIQKLNGDN